MEGLPILLFAAFLTVCMMPSALALECYECSNAPGSEVSKCDSDSIGNITCPQFANRCFTMKARMTIGQTTMDLTMRNCTNSMACDPKSEFNPCTSMNSTGLLSSCEMKCCQFINLCDPYKVNWTTIATQGSTPTSAVSDLAASFGVILVAFVLNMFA